jgi:hypothetical protein
LVLLEYEVLHSKTVMPLAMKFGADAMALSSTSVRSTAAVDGQAFVSKLTASRQSAEMLSAAGAFAQTCCAMVEDENLDAIAARGRCARYNSLFV